MLTILEKLEQTRNNLQDIFEDPSTLSPEQCKALGVVQEMIRDRFDKEVVSWRRTHIR